MSALLPTANEAWFTFTVLQTGRMYRVYSFTGQERVSEPYSFTLELVDVSNALAPLDFLAAPALLRIVERGGGVRLVHGIIRHFEQLYTRKRFTHYRCTLSPRIWFLGLNRDFRIFEKKTVPQIIEQILNEQNFSDETRSFRLQHAKKYQPREYCVQYGESDLHFISRLCEEEGIFFYHEHEADLHRLCFCDCSGGPDIPGAPKALRFFPGSGNPADTAVISRLNIHNSVHSDAAAYREWNFAKPRLELAVAEQTPKVPPSGCWPTGYQKPPDMPLPAGVQVEVYQYPHRYQTPSEGERYVNVQLLRQQTWVTWIVGDADVARLLPGCGFSVIQHPRPDVNADWWLVEVAHRGVQPQVLDEETPDEGGMEYEAHFTAIPYTTRFVPELRHPKNRVLGQQTAIVVGPEGEEIYTDEHGRVRVHFFWEREGKGSGFDKPSCWARVSQVWAGGRYGGMLIPRIGHEVVVSFLEGDPDRPLVTGRVYHGENTPPYALPAHKTRSVLRSLTSPGGERYNEAYFEDTKGKELIFLHAARDMEVDVAEDSRSVIGATRHETVVGESREHDKADVHLSVEGTRRSAVKGADHHTVGESRHTKIAQSDLLETGREVHIKAGEKIVIEAGSALTLKAGGSFLKLDPSGVCAVGAQIRLNSGGSPDSGSGQNAEPPLLPDGVAFEGAPFVTQALDQQIETLRKGAQTGKPFCAVCEAPRGGAK